MARLGRARQGMAGQGKAHGVINGFIEDFAGHYHGGDVYREHSVVYLRPVVERALLVCGGVAEFGGYFRDG